MSVFGHGVEVCTSTTRPTPSEGSLIYETDTNTMRVWDNSTWIKIPTTNDEAYAYIYHNSVVTFAANANTRIPWSVITANKNISLSSGSIVFGLTGVYEVTVGFRFGVGNDVWTGVNFFNTSTGTILQKGYGVGQTGGNDPAGTSWQFLVNITSTTNLHDIRVFRAQSTMTTAVPNSNAGWAYTATIKRLSS